LQGERKFSGDNRPLGQFQLSGIPPAPRGIPQISVTFDLDANGILSVSAKDTATGKEQSIRIEGQGGLSDSDIEAMVQDAAAAEEEDRQRLEEVEARNKLDTLIYQTQKMLNENQDNLDEETTLSVREVLASAQAALDSGENLVEAFEELQTKLHALSSELYKAAQAEEAPAPDDVGLANEDVVDAEFEEAS
jgi:molecular chaperone DnaK